MFTRCNINLISLEIAQGGVHGRLIVKKFGFQPTGPMFKPYYSILLQFTRSKSIPNSQKSSVAQSRVPHAK